MKKILVAILIMIFSHVSVAHAEVSQEKRAEIEKMLRLTGMEKLAHQMMVQMISSFKQRIPVASNDFWTKFQQKLDVHELVEKIIPIYGKYYTIEDLKAINTFYESPAGQKVLSALPQITQESMKIGQEWGERIGKEAAAEAEAEKESKNK